MIDAVIFDLDGLLLDSEPLWRRAEVEVFARAGLRITEDDCLATTGLRIDDAVRHWWSRHPGLSLTVPEAVDAVLDRLVALVRGEGAAMPGAVEAVEFVARRGVRLGLASSSAPRVLDAALARLGLGGRFEVVQSAERERYGKPHPAVYLAAAERLGVAPTSCLAVEDSLNGLVAAKAARMRCLAVPERRDPRFALADLVLPSLTAFDEVAWRALTDGVVAAR